MGTTKANKWAEISDILLKMKADTLREIQKNMKSGAETLAVADPSGDIYDQASSERDRELGLLLATEERKSA
jgi:DnaK suppressor protein